MELMRTQRQHINTKLRYIDRYVAYCLNGIRMECNLVLFSNLCNLFYRLNCSDFVICHHYRNQDCIILYCRLDRLRCYNTELINIKICHLKAVLFQKLARSENCVVFNLCCDNVVAFAFIGKRIAFNCPVIRLTA